MNYAESRPPITLPPDTRRDKLLSALAWAAGLGWLAPMLSSMALARWLSPGRETERLNRLYCWGQLAVLGVRWRAVVDPAVDPAAIYLFLQNHVNHLDHVTLYRATPHFKQGLELKEHFRVPFYGWFMEARGTIGVERTGGGRQSEAVMAEMRREIARAHSILAFPEGTRTTTGRLGPFRHGLFYIARDLGLPIVPVAVCGMYEVLHKGSYVLHPFREVTVYVDAPIATAGLADEELPALAARVHRVMSARVDAHWEQQRQ